MTHSQVQTHLWGRLFNRPLLVADSRAAELAAYLTHRAGLEGVIVGPDLAGVSLAAIQASSVTKYAPGESSDAPPIELYTITDGVAVIRVVGTLVQRLGLRPWSGMVGYDGIRAKIEAALDDPDVFGILIEIDSPGGEVSGCFDLADFIRAAREVKPIMAMATDLACSAAYLIASQANAVATTQTGRIGSVGVVWCHEDCSGLLEKMGVKVTLVHSGAHKVDGNPYEELPPDVLAHIQAELDTVRQMFAAKVQLGRPSLSLDAILATEARVYGPGDALSLGLIDGVMSLDEAVTAFASQLAGSAPAAISSKGATMSKIAAPQGSALVAGLRAAGVIPPAKAKAETPPTEKPEAETEEDETEAAAPEDDEEGDGDDEAAPPPDAPPPEDEEKPKPEAKKSAAAAERQRIAAIMGADEAKGRESLAAHLAFNTSDSVAKALATLKASPKAAQGNNFAANMASVDNPTVGASAPAADPVIDGFAAATQRRYGKVNK